MILNIYCIGYLQMFRNYISNKSIEIQVNTKVIQKNYACIYLTYEWETLVTVYDWFDTFFAPIKVPITYGQVDPSHFPKGRHIFNDDCVDGCQFKLTKLNQQFLHICRQKSLWLCDYLTINEKCKKVFDVKPEKLILRIWNLIVGIENNKWKQ